MSDSLYVLHIHAQVAQVLIFDYNWNDETKYRQDFHLKTVYKNEMNWSQELPPSYLKLKKKLGIQIISRLRHIK